jgi:hypothetical protein
MAIEKLERYSPGAHDLPGGGESGYCEHDEVGDYVLYDAARAREDALLEALKSLTSACWSNRRGRGIEVHAPSDHVLNQAIELVDQIEETR